MATKSYIANLFGTSPIKPLQTHMAAVQSCIRELTPFIEAVFSENWEDAKALQAKIGELENDADVLKKDLRSHLPNTLFMAVSRRDLLEVLTMQDNIANKAKDIAGLILGRKMQMPVDIQPLYLKFIERSIEASEQAQKAINELDELVETGFRGKEVKIVESMLNKLDKVENETDKIQVKIRAKVFKIEKDLPPIDAMFLYRIIEWTGDLGDLSQRVGSRLQIMLAR